MEVLTFPPKHGFEKFHVITIVPWVFSSEKLGGIDSNKAELEDTILTSLI